MASRKRGVAACVAVAVLLVPSSAAAAPVVLADGHVDYAARIVGGTLQSQVKDGTQGGTAWREPADVVFHVRPEARTTVPDDPRLGFLGAPGDPVWLIPQVQRTGILWAGWNTEEVGAGQLAGPVSWRLAAAEGPGAFALFQTDGLGQPDVLFNTRDGLPDRRDVPLDTHAHGNWAFSAEGTYRLTFEMRGTRPSGEAVSDTEVLTVAVGSVDPGSVPPPPPAGDPQPAPTPPPSGQPTRGRLTLTASSARLRGRTLTLRLRLGTRSRVAVTVRRRGRTVARARERSVPAGERRLRVRLNRRLRPGRYEVRVRARAGGGTITRTLRARARARPRSARATAVATAQRKVTLRDGHVDYAARMVGGRLESQIKDGTGGAGRVVWRDPADVVFEVVAAARSTIPDDDGLSFLGEAGDPVWMIPQVQKTGVLWAGWNTEELEAGDVDGAVTWRLTAVDGPGDVALFETGSFGEQRVLFDSADGLPDGFDIPLGTHAHGNWAFRARGTYRLTFAMFARRPSGARLRDSATLTVRVAADSGDDNGSSDDSGSGGADGSGGSEQSAGTGVADDSTSGSESGGDGGSMPNTGAALAPQATAGLLLLLAGLILRRPRAAT